MQIIWMKNHEMMLGSEHRHNYDMPFHIKSGSVEFFPVIGVITDMVDNDGVRDYVLYCKLIILRCDMAYFD